jgi:hypothetical protein
VESRATGSSERDKARLQSRVCLGSERGSYMGYWIRRLEANMQWNVYVGAMDL